MAIVPKKTALTFSADDESSLEKSVTDALSQNMELNMGIRRCSAFPAVNQGLFLCELTTKETMNIIGSLTARVRGRTFVDHAIIHLLYVPVLLEETYAVAELKLKNLATGDELYGGTKVNLNEAFVLTMSWPRSLFSDDVKNHKGLYLGGTVHCASTVPAKAKIGMWYPMWTEKLSNRQLYQQTVAITNTKAMQTFVKKMISSDKEMQSLLKSIISTDTAAKSQENPVSCSREVGLLDKTVSGVDFTVGVDGNKDFKKTERTQEGITSGKTEPVLISDVLVTKESTTNQSDLSKERVDRARRPERLLN